MSQQNFSSAQPTFYWAAALKDSAVSPIYPFKTSDRRYLKSSHQIKLTILFFTSTNGRTQTPSPFLTLSPRFVKQLTASSSLWLQSSSVKQSMSFVSQPMTSLLKAIHPWAGMNYFHPMDCRLQCLLFITHGVRPLTQVAQCHFYLLCG